MSVGHDLAFDIYMQNRSRYGWGEKVVPIGWLLLAFRMVFIYLHLFLLLLAERGVFGEGIPSHCRIWEGVLLLLPSTSEGGKITATIPMAEKKILKGGAITFRFTRERER